MTAAEVRVRYTARRDTPFCWAVLAPGTGTALATGYASTATEARGAGEAKAAELGLEAKP